LEERYGISGVLTRLDSERDQNFLVTTKKERCLLKISNAAEPRGVTNFQTEAYRHIAKKDPAFPVARVLPMVDGEIEYILRYDGRMHVVRLLSWIEGIPLASVPMPKRPDNPEVLGDLLG